MEEDKNAQLEQRLKEFRSQNWEGQILHEVNAAQLLEFFENLGPMKEGELHRFFVKDPFYLSAWARDIHLDLSTLEDEPGVEFQLEDGRSHEYMGGQYVLFIGPRNSVGSTSVAFNAGDVSTYWSQSAPAGKREIRISKGGDLPPTAETCLEIVFPYEKRGVNV
jgi:hypothetical protein